MSELTITKTELMKLIYTEEELKHISIVTPQETWEEHPQINHVMNFNDRVLNGKLENLCEVAKERDISIPYTKYIKFLTDNHLI
tara:strand:+ start:178 stop:429 length:252 start_codon:yes stop_codon:yes gene_type:complete